MTLTERGLNRATLARQLLLAREPLGVVEGTRRIVAIQGQQAASPYIALWNRLDGFDPEELDAAFAGRELVKATLMRFTLHVVHPSDHPAMHKAMQPQLRSRLGDARYTETGLTRELAEAVVEDALEFVAEPRSNAEVEAWLQQRIETDPKRMWWALRTFMPVLHAPTGGPWAFGYRPSYMSSTTPHTPLDKAASDIALQSLVRRYLEGFGPASVADIGQFGLIQRGRVKLAIEALGDKLEKLEGPDGKALYDVPGGLRPDEGTPAPSRLLPMWDSTLLAYADRSRVIPPEYRKLDPARRRVRRRRLAHRGRRDRGDRLPQTPGQGLEGAGRRGPRAHQVPRQARPAPLQPLPPLVAQAPRLRNPGTASPPVAMSKCVNRFRPSADSPQRNGDSQWTTTSTATSSSLRPRC
jgi:hypothetical protein